MAISDMQKVIKIGDTEFTLQKISPREWARLKDRCKDKNGNLKEENLMDEVIKHMVIDPDMRFDDFTDYSAAEEVVREAVSFQSGRELPRE